jgi:hypothetical protein
LAPRIRLRKGLARAGSSLGWRARSAATPAAENASQSPANGRQTCHSKLPSVPGSRASRAGLPLSPRPALAGERHSTATTASGSLT